MTNSSSQLEAIKRDIQEQNITPELAEFAQNLVMGAGSERARIVLIGEAPGKKEDETGQPFVGASGRFLDEMLAGAGLKRGDVYITNIVKYRPPNNRDPSPSEKAAFLPFLLRQLEVINPKVVITLGRHAGLCFMPQLVISRHHGQPQTIDFQGKTLQFIPLYHPAAALYNGSMRQVLIDDFLAAVKFANQPKDL